IDYQGKAIGSLGIEKYNDELFTELAPYKGRSLGFVLAKDYWGRGFMPEAVKRVISYLFEEIGLDFIMCGHFNWNQRSRRVQEKCGFRPYKQTLLQTAAGITEFTMENILWKNEWNCDED
ncbi:MAG: GNAT family N-acetyltransferase, partial [Erysipelotrichaceae bacterium]|nr:GNAT family N-acetyltransferase [Erysipelotrichaceae bacterium]